MVGTTKLPGARRLIAGISAATALTLAIGAAPALASTNEGSPTRATQAQTTHQSKEQKALAAVLLADNPDKAVEISRRIDPRGFQLKVHLLSSASSFVDFLDQQYGHVKAQEQIQQLASISTVKVARQLKENSAGKVYVLGTSDDGTPTVKLVAASSVPGPPAVHPMLGLKCWQAWVGYIAWSIGAGGVCGGLTFAGVVPGVVCDGVVITASAIIDWNKAC